VPFHVEISGGLNHARAFNLDMDELRRRVIEPWLTKRPLDLGEREWAPEESSLRILEGPHLDSPDLAFGQGWSNAERKGEDVTHRIVAEAEPPKLPDAFVIETDLPEAFLAERLPNARAVGLGEVERKIDGRDPQVAAVILLLKKRSQD